MSVLSWSNTSRTASKITPAAMRVAGVTRGDMEAIDNAGVTMHCNQPLQAESFRPNMFYLTFQSENPVTEFHLNGKSVQIDTRLPLQGRTYFFQNPIPL